MKTAAKPRRKPHPNQNRLKNNNDDDSRIIVLSGEVEEEEISDIMAEILEINEEDDEKQRKNKNYVRQPIKLIINTFGGSIYDGLGLIDVIDGSKTEVHTYCYGKAMSMGLIILVCGHKRFCGKYSTIMYHEGLYDMPYEKIKTHKEELAESERIQTILDEILLDRTKLTKKWLQSVKNRKVDWYMPAEEAKSYKIVDEIV